LSVDLYLEGEERFGRLSSYMYSWVAERWIRPLHAFALRLIIREVERLKPKTILDVGMGPGTFTCKVAHMVPGVQVYGVDPSPYMVGRAKRNADKRGVDNLHFTVGSSRSLPDRRFDLAYSVLSFHHWARKDESLRNIHDHLAGGEFLVFEYNRRKLPLHYFPARSHSVTPDTLVELGGRSGFTQVNIEAQGVLLAAIYSDPVGT
jgi:SAM-dependent methyltransferase